MNGYIKFERKLFDYPISNNARVIYALLKSREDLNEKLQMRYGKEYELKYTNRELQKLLGLSNKPITKAINELDEQGLIVAYKEPGKETTYKIIHEEIRGSSTSQNASQNTEPTKPYLMTYSIYDEVDKQ